MRDDVPRAVRVVTALAHRGFSGGEHAVENSMAAFRAAVDLGYEWVETDVHATSDGVLLAFHDTTLERTTDGHGIVAELAWAEVSQARIAGVEPIATVDELFSALPHTCFNIDVKSSDAVAPLVTCIERHGAHERVRVASFSDRRRRSVVAALSHPVRSSPGQHLMTALWLIAHAPLPQHLRARLAQRMATGIDAVQIPEHAGPVRVLTRALLCVLHDAGLEVHVWTINDRPSMERLLDLGVDGLITDRADLLRDVLIARGLWRT